MWLLALLGCVVDADRDGWTAGEDCDESTAAVHPDAPEICDGVDQDCDGEIDEGTPELAIYYEDADWDGHGDPLSAVPGCTLPWGYSELGDDCDDLRQEIHPGAAEVCNGLDDDCDGAVDADDPDAIGAHWHLDADGDGYGDPDTRISSCEPVAGRVDQGGDCADDDPAVHPGATERCGAPDSDCDGLDGDDDPDVAAPEWFTDADGDAHGDPSTGVAACAKPTGKVAAGDDCDDANADVHPGAAEVCGNGIDDDCDGGPGPCALAGGPLGDADALLRGPASIGAGFALAALGDVDGDGLDDLGVGGPSVGKPNGSGWGWVVHGAPAASVSLAASASHVGGQGARADQLGFSIASAGDWDGDGRFDLVVGAPGDDRRGTDGGAVYIASGPVAGKQKVFDVTVQLLARKAGDRAGRAVAVGDLTGDGRPDLAVGTGIDLLHVVPGPQTGIVQLATTGFMWTGALGTEAATSLAAGDLDGDGIDDLVVGAPKADPGGKADAGTAWVLIGPIAAAGPINSGLPLEGSLAGERAGQAVAIAGDVDGDGTLDLIVGAPRRDHGGDARAGAAFVRFGPITAGGKLTAAEVMLSGEDADDQAGFSVAGAGDVDGDGRADLLVGAPYRNGPPADVGAAYVILAPEPGIYDLSGAWLGEAGADYAGYAVSGAGDLDGDGLDDLAIGAPYAGADDHGRVYVIFGRAL